MDITPGVKTSELWVSLILGVLVPLFGIFVLKGLITEEESGLLLEVIAATIPLSMAIIAVGYSNSRAKTKASQMNAAASMFASDMRGNE